jgi:hypothetical protein
LFLSLIGACSEPFSFDIVPGNVDVVDGRLSTIPGNSNISIYQIEESGIKKSLSDLEVSVISTDGSKTEFYFDSEMFSYKPVAETFAATAGSGYKMMAKAKDGSIYESSFDAAPEEIEFQIALDKAVRQELFSELNEVIDIDGIAGVAVIPTQGDNFYLKLDFRYYYENIFDRSVIEIQFNPDEFVLVGCDESLDCSKQLEIPVGFKQTEKPWRFQNPASFCDNARDCASPTEDCCSPCCMESTFWSADYEISLKSLSLSSYNYWKNIQRLRENDGLIFDTNPFPIKGNVDCTECENTTVGFFRVYSETISVINKRGR